MPWWGWVILGLGLLGIELFAIDAQFYLVFIGAAAVVVGLASGSFPIPDWAQWLLFAGLAVITMVAFRRRVYALVRGKSGHVEQRVTLGDVIVVPALIEPQQTCRVDYRGTSWTARNIDGAALAAGTEAAIVHVDGFTLHLKRAPAQA
jgi:membrane protein implicated in regulation of membrane protease activity